MYRKRSTGFVRRGLQLQISRRGAPLPRAWFSQLCLRREMLEFL